MCEFANCPICEAEVSDSCLCTEPECTICHNTGWWYFDENGNILTREQYDATPEDERLMENCSQCNPYINGKFQIKQPI